MTKDESKELVQYLCGAYKKDYPASMGMRQLQALVDELEFAYKEYDFDDVIRAYREFALERKWSPYPREIIERLGKPKRKDDSNRKHRLCRDSDGCVYDLDDDGGTIIYNPEWDDDDRRVIEYFRRFQE